MMEKKLTIEEKAKAYDGNYKAYTELINRLEDVKEAIKKQNYGNAMDILCKPYPGYQITTSTELKESDSEKIKKELIDFVKSRLAGFPQCERFIAWLEKQGIPTDKIVKRATTEKQRVLITETNDDANIDWDTRSLQDVKLLLECGLNYIKKLEKQDEQTEAQAENNLPSFDEAQGTIIVDKVEPKFNFKVGQWIVATGKCVYLITKIDGFNVTLVDTNGDEYVFDSNSLEDAHEWTIEDAKDGDVLCYKGEISLYKHDIKNCTKQGTTFGGFVYHCCYDGKRFITNSLYSLREQDKMDIHPATQEQRSLLFQKVREAGYEWDDEKKVLEKVEVEFNGEDYGIDSLWHAQNILERTLGKVDGYQSDDGILEHKCAITAVKKLYKQKSVEWSEKDDEMLDSIIEEVRYIGDLPDYPTKEENELYDESLAKVDWLKSIKERVQPKQERNKKAQQVIKDAACFILSCVNNVETKQEEERLEELADKLQDLAIVGLKGS